MVKAILFDMDGVLVDSEDVSIQLGIDYFKTKGLQLTKEDFFPHIGAGEKAFFLGPSQDKGFNVNLHEASEYFKTHYEAAINEHKAALGGVLNIKNAKSAGIITAVVSSAPSWKVKANIKAIGLDEKDFDRIFSAESIKRNKPYPDIYLNAAISLGLDPTECLVCEDSINGIKAGKSAGMVVLAVLTTENAESVASAGADYIFSDLSLLPSFTSISALNDFLDGVSTDINKDSVLYGAHYINPLERRLPPAAIDKMMLEAAKSAWNNAYTPYSHFNVGAAILSAKTGRIYSGCNVENSSYGSTICAERNAILHAIAVEGIIGIDKLLVYSDDNPPAPPCAQCLQVLAEFSKPDTKVVLVSKRGERVEYAFKELLPHPFIFPTLRK